MYLTEYTTTIECVAELNIDYSLRQQLKQQDASPCSSTDKILLLPLSFTAYTVLVLTAAARCSAESNKEICLKDWDVYPHKERRGASSR